MKPSFRCVFGLVFLANFAGCASFTANRNSDPTNYENISRRLNYSGRSSKDLDRQLDEAASTSSVNLDSIGDFADSVERSIQKITGTAPKPDQARLVFQQAEKQFTEAQQTKDERQRKTKYRNAGVVYLRAAEMWPNSAIEHKAMFKAGTCYFWADHYVRCNDVYETMLKRYPNSRFLDTVEAHRFSIAQYWLKYNKASPQSYWAVNFYDNRFPINDLRGRAIKILDLVRFDDPTGKLADDATLAVANAYFASGEFLKADEYYTDLRSLFTNSEHQFAAHFLGMKAKLKSYQGPEYSATALKEAEALGKQIRKQFPGEAAKHRETLQRAAAEIRKEKAKRAWNLAQYYEGRWQYGAARYYYQQLTREYPSTPIGNQAEARLRTLAGKPDNPSQPLPWLVQMFPDTEVAKPILATAPSINNYR